MIMLDSVDEIKKLDKGNMLGSILRLADQFRQAWKQVKELPINESCSLAKNVVISGMGGSALGSRIIDSLLSDRVRTPIEIVNDYRLPNYVNNETLVVISSYSGNTEETISAFEDAQRKNARIFGITTGGRLSDLLKENKIDSYVFKPINNPSQQPRMGLGYSISATLAVLSYCNFIHLDDDEMEVAIKTLEEFVKEFSLEIPADRNLAKSLSVKLKDAIVVLIASEHLIGAAHAFKNQLNENAKVFSTLFDLPELNHHLMEGLRNPVSIKKLLHFVFLESDLYLNKVTKRYPITKEVIEENDVPVSVYKLRSEKKLDQILEVLALGSYVSFYLAMLYHIDPSPIPWVDYFKKRLTSSKV